MEVAGAESNAAISGCSPKYFHISTMNPWEALTTFAMARTDDAKPVSYTHLTLPTNREV